MEFLQQKLFMDPVKRGFINELIASVGAMPSYGQSINKEVN